MTELERFVDFLGMREGGGKRRLDDPSKPPRSRGRPSRAETEESERAVASRELLYSFLVDDMREGLVQWNVAEACVSMAPRLCFPRVYGFVRNVLVGGKRLPTFWDRLVKVVHADAHTCTEADFTGGDGMDRSDVKPARSDVKPAATHMIRALRAQFGMRGNPGFSDRLAFTVDGAPWIFWVVRNESMDSYILGTTDRAGNVA